MDRELSPTQKFVYFLTLQYDNVSIYRRGYLVEFEIFFKIVNKMFESL